MFEQIQGVLLTEFIQDMELLNLTPDLDISEVRIKIPELNRCGMALTGFYELFEKERIQVIGIVENSYLHSLDPETRLQRMENLLSRQVKGLIFTTGIVPDPELMSLIIKYETPTFSTTKTTSIFSSEALRWLSMKLAPMISIHGVLVDVFGEGVVIMGESGIGKSEAALELVKRGHRLVSDDVVEIRRISDVDLEGSAPDITRHFIEMRGVGIIDVKTLYGVLAVENTHSIDLVIKLEDWDRDKQYDRLGLEAEYTEFLGNKVVCHTLPVRPGRNLAVIVETAAINNRQKRMGYNAAQELYDRVTRSMQG